MSIDQNTLPQLLKSRFEKHKSRHAGVSWSTVARALETNKVLLSTVLLMENTGGEPDVLDFSTLGSGLCFVDCSVESPAGRRSLCYDKDALDKRKENKPTGSVVEMTYSIGITLLDEMHYKALQKHGPFDTKTSSWILTPYKIRQLGGALFSDFRYGEVFVYHNGADSYYASRGFRGYVQITC